MAEIGDPRFLAWYLQQLNDFPAGVIPLSWAARACAVTREGLLSACRASKVRLLTWQRKPWPAYLVPIEDVIKWQQRRPGINVVAKLYDRLLPMAPTRDERWMEADKNMIVCSCGTRTLLERLKLKYVLSED